MNIEIEVILSSHFVKPDDPDVEDEVNEIYKKLENLCKGKDMHFIDSSNIKRSSLNSNQITT